LSKGYLRSLLQYLSSVYDLGGKIKKLRDKRTSPKITTSSIAFTLLIGFMLKIRSFNQLDDWLEHNDFRRIVPRKMRLPRIDAIRDSLKVIDITDIMALHHSIIRTSIHNKLVRNGTIDDYKVVAFDGVELFESTRKSCDNCLTRVIKDVPHYFHRSIVGAYVGQDPHIIIGQEMLKPKLDSASKDEGELTAAKRLLQQLHKQHRHFADVIVYDALACNAPWVNTVKSYNIDAVVRVKDMRLNIVKDAKASLKNSTSNITWIFQKTSTTKVTISAWETSVKMKGVTEPLRFIKFKEKTTDCNTNKSKYNQTFIITTAPDMALTTLHKIIHARWGIENNIFRQLKTEWHMNHCFIHDKNALEATLLFMIISFNLMQLFFFRRMNNFRSRKLLQIEVLERIAKEMMSYDARGEYLIDTG